MSAQTLPKRAEVPVELTWDLTTMYPDVAVWEFDFSEVERLTPTLAQYKGTLSASADNLLALLQLRDRIGQTIEKLWCYASQSADQDTTVSENVTRREQARQLYSAFGSALAFVEPEILAIETAVLDGFIAESSGLRVYEQELKNLMRKRPFVRSAEVEDVLARAMLVHAGSGQAYDMLCDADMKFPVIGDGKGQRVRLTHGNFVEGFLQMPSTRVRRRAYDAVFGTYESYRNTIAATYQARVNSEIFEARVRGHQSTRAMRLGETNIPLSVYDNLIDTVHASIPRMMRYLELRKRVLGRRKLNFSDLYVPLVAEVKYEPTYAESQAMVLAALKPLGTEYVGALANGFRSRWVDVVENENKASGAYSGGGHLTPPYMLLNWQNTLESMFTLAHEAGHSMHSWFTRATQPFCYSNYSMFVAEVASTLNEALLADHLLKTSGDKAMRRYIINHQLENIRQTLYRQTLFAEFEKMAHERAEAGDVLTADTLCDIYRELARKYYGDAVEIDDRIAIEWARIPHFYNPFYVYQYATGISAAWSLSSQILTEGEPAVQRYLKFLSSGSSDYSINLLRDAGVDLSTPQPIVQAFDAFDAYLAEFEKLA